jgi:hypothetical protein
MSASRLATELEGIPNPFRSGITRDAWDPEWVDVPQIHAGASAEICQEVEAIAGRGGSRGMLVYGEPGSGKTHLLNRVRRWCLQNGALFSGFRLQCAPQTLWRHLRREFAADLLHRLPDGSRQIDRLTAAGEEAIRRGCGFALAQVLLHWRDGRFVHECVAWLQGDRLPEAALQAMGLAEESEMEEEAEDEARRVLKELIALAAPAPVVLALDQVEAMQADSQDPRGLRALGSTVAALRDESVNLLAVTCVQTSFLEVLQSVLHKADMDRMGEMRLQLLPLEEEQARALLAARLDSDAELREHRLRKADPLWPFTEYAVRHLLMKGREITPRRLIIAARDLFEQLRTGKPAGRDADAARFLAAELRRRAEVARPKAAAEGNEFLLDGLRRLMPLAGWRLLEPRPAGVDLLLEKDGRPLAVAVLNQGRMLGAAQRLRKIGAALEGRRVRLVRAAALPVSAKAHKTREELSRLEGSGARLVRLTEEALAALEACRTLLADAAAGDLHSDGDTLPREFVEQWLRSGLPEELGAVVREIEAGGAAGPQEGHVDALIELIRECKVLAVEDAAARLGIGAEEARRCADQAADIVASVGSPAQVFYERRGA